MSTTWHQIAFWLLQNFGIAVLALGVAVHMRVAAVQARREGEPKRADRLDLLVLLPFTVVFCVAPAGAALGVVTIVRGWWA